MIYLFVLELFFFLTNSQNINVSTPIMKNMAGYWQDTTGNSQAVYTLNFIAGLSKFDETFTVKWTSTWDGGFDLNLGIGANRAIAHPDGSVIVCGMTYSPVRSVPLPGANNDIFYHRIKSDGSFAYTILRGGINWDNCHDLSWDRASSPRWYYIVGYRKGDYLGSNSGTLDAILLQINFLDGSLRWSRLLPVATSWEEVYAVSETSDVFVQAIILTSTVPQSASLATFYIANGSSVNSYPINYPIVRPIYDQMNGVWWIVDTAYRIMAYDQQGNVKLTIDISSNVNSIFSLASDNQNFNLFLAFKEPNNVGILQIGILSRKIWWNRWTTTADIKNVAVIGRNVWVTGTGYVRIFPNATLLDTCEKGSVMNKNLTCRVCPNGTYASTNECLTCLVGQFCNNGLSFSCPGTTTTVYTGAQRMSECVCTAGNYPSATNVCMPCPIGAYCTGNSSLIFCGSNSNTSTTGQSEPTACQCNPGYAGFKGDCRGCPLGYYCPGGGQILFCSPNSNTTTPYAKSLKDCECIAGYFGSGGDCRTCPPNNYCPGGSVALLCGPNSSSNSGSVACQCNAGFVSKNGTCQPCELGDACHHDTFRSTSTHNAAQETNVNRQPDSHRNKNFWIDNMHMALALMVLGVVILFDIGLLSGFIYEARHSRQRFLNQEQQFTASHMTRSRMTTSMNSSHVSRTPTRESSFSRRPSSAPTDHRSSRKSSRRSSRRSSRSSSHHASNRKRG